MRFIGRAFRFFWGAFMIGSVLAAIAARVAKQRIAAIDTPDADEIRVAAIFEPLSFHSTATSFRGGSVDCWYGGGVIDLRDAVLDPAGASLRVRAIFGGGQILVPETWRVTSHVMGIGGLGDARPHVEPAADAPHLSIEGIALFGGFAVMSELSEAETRGLEKAIARKTRSDEWRARRGGRWARRGHRESNPMPQTEPAS
jgi:hypothetical protein